MLSKRHESTEVGRRAWLHAPSGTLVHQQWHSPSSWNIKKETKMYMYHFKSDFIYNMDHMRISGTEIILWDKIHVCSVLHKMTRFCLSLQASGMWPWPLTTNLENL